MTWITLIFETVYCNNIWIIYRWDWLNCLRCSEKRLCQSEIILGPTGSWKYWLALLIRPLICTVAGFIFTGLCFPGPVLTGSHSAAVRCWNAAWQPAGWRNGSALGLSALVWPPGARVNIPLRRLESVLLMIRLLHLTAAGACECVFLLEQGLVCVYVSDETPLKVQLLRVLEALISFLFFWAAADSNNHHFQTPFHLSLCLGAAAYM